ncbi:hypothetical protein Tco_1368839 [Tanacetum coccineum]
MVDGDDDSEATEFDGSEYLNDEEDSGTRLEPGRQKKNSKEFDDDDDDMEEKKDDKKDDDDDGNDDDDHTDHASIKDQVSGSQQLMIEKMQTPIPSPTRSLSIDLSSDKDITQELTGVVQRMCRYQGIMMQQMEKKYVTNHEFHDIKERVDKVLNDVVPKIVRFRQQPPSIPPPSYDREIDEIHESTLLSLPMHKTAKAAKEQENMAIVQERILEENIENMVDGDDDFEATKFDGSEYLNDEEDSGTRLEPVRHKKNSEEVDDDDDDMEEKKDDKKDDDDDDGNDDDDHTDHASIKDQKSGSQRLRIGKMQTPIPSPPRSFRIDLSSDKDITQELMGIQMEKKYVTNHEFHDIKERVDKVLNDVVPKIALRTNRTPRAHRTPNPATVFVDDVLSKKKKGKCVDGETSSPKPSLKVRFRQQPPFIPPPSYDKERDEIHEATLLSLTMHKTTKATEDQENVAIVLERILEEDIEKMVDDDDDSEATEFDGSEYFNDEEDSEKKDDKKDDDDGNDDDDHTHHASIKD